MRKPIRYITKRVLLWMLILCLTVCMASCTENREEPSASSSREPEPTFEQTTVAEPTDTDPSTDTQPTTDTDETESDYSRHDTDTDWTDLY